MESIEESFAKNLLCIVKKTNIETYSLFLASSERNELAKACLHIKCFFDWNFNFQEFYRALTSISFQYPSLEFLWNLNILQIMPLEIYIINISDDKDILQKFTESVIKLCSQDIEEIAAQYMIQTGFLSYFVSKSFPAMDVKNCDIKIKEICLDIIKLLLQDIFSTPEKEIEAKRFTCFFSLWSAGILEEFSLLNFCSFALDCYLNLIPIVKGLDVFRVLENPCFNKSPYHLLVVIEKLLKSMKSERISYSLTSAVQKEQVNAASMLVVVKAFIRTHEDSTVIISNLLSELMTKAYEKYSHELLLRSLLIGYEAAYQTNISSHIHCKLWLQTMFKECGHSKNKDSFSLLIKVLSDIVPCYQNIEYLKIAIDLYVSIPSELQTTYSDYITLLKTRIQDMKPAPKPEETVEKVLGLFESLGKIPPVVMETSLLQKHKFLNEFLPALLIPRVVPTVPDIREKFIEALHKAGKIPNNILQKYRNDCMQEQNKLIADITVIENSDDFLDEDMDVCIKDF